MQSRRPPQAHRHPFHHGQTCSSLAISHTASRPNHGTPSPVHKVTLTLIMDRRECRFPGLAPPLTATWRQGPDAHHPHILTVPSHLKHGIFLLGQARLTRTRSASFFDRHRYGSEMSESYPHSWKHFIVTPKKILIETSEINS
jgi:hypothetical protein